MTEVVEVVVGTVGKAHGLRGEATIEVRTDEPDRRFADGAELRIEGSRRTLRIEASHWHSGRLLLKFAGVPDRTAVEALRGSVLLVDVPADEVPTDEDEFYDRQLVGLRVLRADGTEVGRVVEVVHLPAQDLLAVETDLGEKLVPFVEQLVPEVDLAAGTCTLADVAGLVDDPDAETSAAPDETSMLDPSRGERA